MVQKAAARAVDMFIGQDADVELGRQPVRERLADGCAQGVGQEAAPVAVAPAGQDGLQGDGQPAALQQLHPGRRLLADGRASRCGRSRRQDGGGIVPQGERRRLRGSESLQQAPFAADRIV